MKKSITNIWDIKTIVYLALYLAIIIVFTFTPYTGYITVGIVSITTIPLIILIASIHLGYIGILWTCFNFGLWSFVGSIILQFPIFNLVYISLVPRIVLGLILCGLYYLLFKVWSFNLASVAIYAFCIFMLNTMLVSSALLITIQFKNLNIGNAKVWFGLIWINMLVEWGVLEVISLALYPFLKWAKNKTAQESWKESKY
ncbi:hypothetical protein ACNQ21_01775 [Mycoplasma sp. VS299A]|uniref:hypothetical protein n=1 Tax=Mycoplasma sp. VS299A TaxID=3401690 RepID=UPI003AAD844D